jgi:DNA invertase Pin-like site-specific DNA recombinase
MTLRAVGYPRVSSAAQRERDTIASQLRVLPEFIERQGWTLVKPIDTYSDDGRTAKAGHLEARTGLAALMRDAALGLFDVVVVFDIDRLTRSEDLAERGMILGAFQRAGVRVASATTGQVLDLQTSLGDLFSGLQAFFAAEWSRKHRARVNEGRVTAVARNRKPAGRPPYWLKWSRDNYVWTLREDRAPIVVEMFERVADGESCRAVADDLHRRGAPRPHGEWSRSRVQRIIRSRAAVGEWLVDKHRALTLSVPPIIDEDLWQRAQRSMAANAHRGLRKTRHEYLLESLGVCAQCGSPMGIRSAVYDKRRGGRWNPAAYTCRSRRIFRLGEVQCGTPHVLVADADARAWSAIAAELNDPGLAAEILGEIEQRDGDAATWTRDADGYRNHLGRLERVEEGVLERYRRGLISDGALDGELGRIRRERDAVRAQLATAEAARAQAVDTQGRLEDARRTLKDLRAALGGADFKTRRKLLELLVPSGGVVFVGNTMRITMLIPRGAAGVSWGGTLPESSTSTHLKVRLIA